MMSMYADRVQASYDGATSTGTLTMNGMGTACVTAARPPPRRVIWHRHHGRCRRIVGGPVDRTITGVMDNSARRPQGL